MPAGPDDDFRAFEGREQMFFGLRDPYGLMRCEVEDALRQQVTDTEVLSIATQGEPKFLTLGKKQHDEHVIVTDFAFCVRVKLTVLFDQRRKGELLEATLTFLFGNIDADGRRFRSHFDAHAEAARCFDDAVFKQRFLAFRAEAK